MLDIAKVKIQLEQVGFYYQKGENTSIEWGTELTDLLELARGLGELYIPDGLSANRPVIETAPSAEATRQQPFDHRSTIGWHSDFSTMENRPQYSIFSIRRQDPKGIEFGAWGVLPVKFLLLELAKQPNGDELLAELAKPVFPFPINDGQVAYYPILIFDQDDSFKQFRFYRYAITQGLARANLTDKQASKIRHLIDSVEQLACKLGEKRLATTNSLLIVNNHICLHNRFEQSIGEYPRQSNLVFVQ